MWLFSQWFYFANSRVRPRKTVHFNICLLNFTGMETSEIKPLRNSPSPKSSVCEIYVVYSRSFFHSLSVHLPKYIRVTIKIKKKKIFHETQNHQEKAIKVAAMPLKLEIQRLHTDNVGTNTRSGTKVIFMLLWLVHAFGTLHVHAVLFQA